MCARAEIDKLQDELQAAEEEIAGLKRQMLEYPTELQRLVDEKNRTQSKEKTQIAELSLEVEIKTRQLAMFEHNYYEMNDEREKYQRANKKLSKEIRIMKEEMATLMGENDELVELVEKLERR